MSAPRKPPTSTLPAWAVACFFVSGAAGLLYEIVWSKQLAYLLGSSLHAVATVTAAFLCGLAIGARALGVPLARRGDGARTYAILEAGVAVLGVALLPLLRALEPVVGQAYRQLGGESPAFAAVRFGLLFVVLLPPTVLMGATLPVLVQRFERELVGPALARLYALNTFGAVAGSALGGFVLMPRLGLFVSTLVAAGLNAGVALLAWTAGGRGPAAEAPAATAPPAPGGGAGRWAFAALFAASGFAALAFQIAWVRLFSLVFGSSVYSFAGVLGVYLLGLALGSAAIGPLLRHATGLRAFARLQLGLALVAAVVLHGFAWVPERMYALATRAGGDWGALFAGQLGVMALMLLPPCAILGAVFPVAARLLQRDDGGDAAGFAYAVNTVGTIAGSLVAGFVLIPDWGVQLTHVAALGLSAAIGAIALAVAFRRREAGPMEGLLALAAVVVVALLVRAAPPWDEGLMSAGLFRPTRVSQVQQYARVAQGSGSALRKALDTERVLYYREGENGTVLVGCDEHDTRRWLKVGGKVDASTTDMETQVLLGLLPAALADSGARTLVIGLGSGYTAAAALAAGAGRTDVVELERGVVEASEFFLPGNSNPGRDPRVTLMLGDARTHLEHTATRYGLVISEPSNPWIAGVNNLFTVDFYRRVRARLAPDGVFCQWMQLYEIAPATIRSMLASYLQVFPEGQLFVVWRDVDVLLIAAPPGRALSLERLRSPDVRRMLDVARIRDPEDLAAYWCAPLAALAPAVRGAELNRDDRPLVEYRAPRDLVEVGRAALSGAQGAIELLPQAERRPAGALFSAWPPDDWYARRAHHFIALADGPRTQLVVAGARADGRGALAAALDGEWRASETRRRAMDLVSEARGQAANPDLALQTLARAQQLDPGCGAAWVTESEVRRSRKDYAGAAAALAHIVRGRDPDVDADAEVQLGLVAIGQDRRAEALRHFAESQRLAPTKLSAYTLEVRLRAGTGDFAGARDVVRRGLVALPGNPELESMLSQLGR